MAGTAARGEAEAADDPRQVLAQYEIVQRQLQATEGRLAQLESALMETQQASVAAKAIAEATAEQQVLVPLGAGLHAPVRMAPGQPMLVPIGAGYYTERPAAEAAAALEQRVKSLTASFNNLASQAERLAQVSAAMNEQLSQFSQSHEGHDH
jgi:prefoldin alpha subunit